jgi:hypothetical protein
MMGYLTGCMDVSEESRAPMGSPGGGVGTWTSWRGTGTFWAIRWVHMLAVITLCAKNLPKNQTTIFSIRKVC